MSHPVLALGAAAFTAAGHVWWLPALADLRAGDDRPRSTRLNAQATLATWTGGALAAVLLAAGPAVAAIAAAGLSAAAGLLLRVRSHGQVRVEQREARALRLALHRQPLTHQPDLRTPRRAVRAWLLSGTTLTATAALLLPALGIRAAPALLTATGAGLAALLAALLHARTGRRALLTARPRPPRSTRRSAAKRQQHTRA